MGLLENKTSDENILTKHGFKFKTSSVTGHFKNCYEKTIALDSSYVMWVAVKTDTSEVFIYIEYDCGGEIASREYALDNTFSNERAFFEELDDIVTMVAEEYND